ncbi:MAG: hypothetical protein V3W44_09820 [Dehalococcoidales bacterium]
MGLPISIFIALLSLAGLVACATNPNAAPSSPPEVQLITQAVVSSTIRAENVPMDELNTLKAVLMSANTSLKLALEKDPAKFADAHTKSMLDLSAQYSTTLGPYYDIVEVVLGIAIIRLQPVIDAGETELASQYLKAVFTGALRSINVALTREDIQA